MKTITNKYLAIALGGIFVFATMACGEDISGNPHDPLSGSSSSINGTQCNSGDDCPTWACYCEEGAPVNSRSCRNGRCADPTEFCDEFCNAFGTEWTGQYSLVDDTDTDTDTDTDESSTETGSGEGTNNTTEPDCREAFNDNTCGSCARVACCEKGAACANDYNCSAIASCIPSCVAQGAALAYCTNSCYNTFSPGISLYQSYNSCLSAYCYSACQ